MHPSVSNHKCSKCLFSRDRERTKKWKPVSDSSCVVRSIYKPFDHLGRDIKIEYSHVILHQTFILHRQKIQAKHCSRATTLNKGWRFTYQISEFQKLNKSYILYCSTILFPVYLMKSVFICFQGVSPNRLNIYL